MIKVFTLFFLLSIPTHLALGQSPTKISIKVDTIVKTTDYRFERNYFVRSQNNALDTAEQATEKLPSFDLSFLENYEYKTYKMGDFYMNSLESVPFSNWEQDLIPYYLREQTFTVLRKKKDKK